MAGAKSITVIAVGDVNLNRKKPETTYAHLLQAADITFGQL